MALVTGRTASLQRRPDAQRRIMSAAGAARSQPSPGRPSLAEPPQGESSQRAKAPHLEFARRKRSDLGAVPLQSGRPAAMRTAHASATLVRARHGSCCLQRSTASRAATTDRRSTAGGSPANSAGHTVKAADRQGAPGRQVDGRAAAGQLQGAARQARPQAAPGRLCSNTAAVMPGSMVRQAHHEAALYGSFGANGPSRRIRAPAYLYGNAT